MNGFRYQELCPPLSPTVLFTKQGNNRICDLIVLPSMFDLLDDTEDYDVPNHIWLLIISLQCVLAYLGRGKIKCSSKQIRFIGGSLEFST